MWNNMGNIGLALEGGGARGAYHLGAYRALMELGFDVAAVTGSSVGALNGALIVQGDWQRAYDMWQNLNLSDVIQVDDNKLQEVMALKVTSEQLSYMVNQTKKIFSDKGLDINPLKELIQSNLDADKFLNSKMEFGLTTYNLTDKCPIDIYKENMDANEILGYLIASASLPIFKNETFKDKIYIDGYFNDNLPINMLLRKGYSNIIAIRTVKSDKLPSKLIKSEDEFKLTVIRPSDDLGGMLEFKPEVLNRNMKMGYYDAFRILNKYKGRHYCISEWENEEKYIINFLELETKEVNYISSRLRCKSEKSRKRHIMETVVPEIARIVEADIESDYIDICVYAMEYLAKRADIDRYQFYTFDELKLKILENEELMFANLKSSFSIKSIFADNRKQLEAILKFVKNC